MAIEIMAQIINEYDLPPREKYILMLYANYSNKEGHGVYPSQSTMAKISGYTRQTISKITEILRRGDLLVRIGKHKSYRTLEWSVNISWEGTRADIEKIIVDYNKETCVKTGLHVKTGIHIPVNTGRHAPVKTGLHNPLIKPPGNPFNGRLAVFSEISGIKPIKADKKDWEKTDQKWEEMGITEKDIPKMYEYAIENFSGVAKPGSITSAYNMMKTSAPKKTSGHRVAE